MLNGLMKDDGGAGCALASVIIDFSILKKRHAKRTSDPVTGLSPEPFVLPIACQLCGLFLGGEVTAEHPPNFRFSLFLVNSLT